MIETGKILNGDCVEVMKTLPEGSVDLIVTSPPYGVGIAYDVHEDDVEFDEYIEFAKNCCQSSYKIDKYANLHFANLQKLQTIALSSG